VLHQNFRLSMYRLHPLRVSWGLCVALVLFGLWVTSPGRALAVRVASADGTGVDGEVAKTRTDDAGRYRFENLPRGTHKVTLDPATLPISLRPAEGETVPALWVVPGQEQTSAALASGVRFTAAYHQDSGAIAGLVFWDRDDDGFQGPGEMGLAGVTVIDPTIHQYFVPFDDRDLIAMLGASNTCQSSGIPVGNLLTSGVSVVASSNGTVYYYDHWEDGYDADPLQPGSTTETGTLDTGQVRLFSNDIDTTLVGTVPPPYYDGGDRITIVGQDVFVTRFAYPTNPSIGPMLAGAWRSNRRLTGGLITLSRPVKIGGWEATLSLPAFLSWRCRTIPRFTSMAFRPRRSRWGKPFL